MTAEGQVPGLLKAAVYYHGCNAADVICFVTKSSRNDPEMGRSAPHEILLPPHRESH